MHCRLLCLRAKGVTCTGFSYVDRRCRVSRPENIVLGSLCAICKCHLYALDKLVIGDGTIVGDDCFLCGGTHDIDSEAFELITGPITIGKHVWIANGATILPGVTIGDGAVIGARAVVGKDIPAGAVVVGNPGRVVRIRSSYPDRETLHLVRVDVKEGFERFCRWAQELVPVAFEGKREEGRRV